MRRRRALLLAATMTMTGCIWQSAPRNPFDEARQGAGTIRLIVQNHNFHRMFLKALGRVQHRIGFVSGHDRSTFRLEWPDEEVLIIEIDQRPGGTFMTNSVSLVSGETAILYIQNPISASSLVRGSGPEKPEPDVH